MAQRLKLAALFLGSLALFVAIAELALRLTLPEGYTSGRRTSASGSRPTATS